MDSMSLATEVTAVLFAVLAGVSTLARCYVRFFVLSKGRSWDDWLLLLALAFFFGLVALAVAMTDWKVGQPSSYNDPNAAVELLKLIFFFESAYGLCVLALKLSIAIALLRIMVKATHLLQRRIVQVVLCLNVATGIAYFFLVIFQCSPVDFYWRDDIPGTCVPFQTVNNVLIVTGSLNTLCDFVFTFLPMYVVWKLQMPPRLKLAVCGILGLGMIASVATIVRFYYISLSTNETGQEAAFVVGYVVWSNVEIGLGIIACNLVTLRPLFRFLGDKAGWSSESQPGHSPGLMGGGAQRPWQMIPAATEKHRNGSNSYSLEMLRPTGPQHDGQALTPPTYHLRDDESDGSIDPNKDLEANDRAAWKSSEVRVHQSTL